VGIGLVRPVIVRPVAGVWSSVDSRPVPPALRFADEPVLPFGAAFLATFRAAFPVVFLAAGRPAALPRAGLELFALLGRLALEAVERRFGADALLAGRLAAFFPCGRALRTGFLAIL
jgi:hypothetical protein